MKYIHILESKIQNPDLQSVQERIFQKIDNSYRSDIEFCSAFASESDSQTTNLSETEQVTEETKTEDD